MDLKVGDNVWWFDEYRRVYRKDPNGQRIGGPVWREHWRQIAIVDETSRSWVLQDGRKLPKKGPLPTGFAVDENAIAELEWLNENRHYIVREVEWIKDPAVLRKIVALIGYEEKIRAGEKQKDA